MGRRTPLHPALACVPAALLAIAAPAHAVLTPLSEAQLSQVHAQAVFDPGSAARVASLDGLLAVMSAPGSGATSIDADAFDAAMAARGMSAAIAPLYQGGAVTQWTPSVPGELHFDASQLVSAVFGVHYDAPALGAFSVHGLQASGTTFWVWSH